MQDIVHITSRDNLRVKDARQVRDGKQRDRIFVEGARLLEELVRSQVRIDCLFISDDGFERAPELIETSGAGEIYRLTDSVFQSISDTVTSQGLVAIAERPTEMRSSIEKRLLTSSAPIVVFLHQTNNPSNLGAVIRTAEAAGAAGVIVSAGSADAFSPKAVRAAMGSSFRLPIWTDVELDEALEWAVRNDLRTVATEAAATKSYSDLDWTQPHMILLGSEAHGLPDAELQKVDERVFIPMEEPVESLNLAVACGVFLFEARRQNSSR